jgi:hypothetical protein
MKYGIHYIAKTNIKVTINKPNPTKYLCNKHLCSSWLTSRYSWNIDIAKVGIKHQSINLADWP